MKWPVLLGGASFLALTAFLLVSSAQGWGLVPPTVITSGERSVRDGSARAGALLGRRTSVVGGGFHGGK